MISIITAIHNQLEMNKLFWEYLKKYTVNKFELIIIDNDSNDGSREFFENIGAHVKVIVNGANYSYPYCQNLGLKYAKYDVLAFLNNDLLVSPQWDERLLQVLGKDNRHIISLASNDRLYNKPTTKKLSRKWKYIKYPLMAVFGQGAFSLRLMVKLCYGNWEKYCDRVFKKYHFTFTEGFSGSAIIMNRTAIEKIGEWDLSQQGADFDTFYRSCHRSEEVGDVKPMAIVNGIFVHHYRRLTMNADYPPFVDAANLTNLESKWGNSRISRWLRIVNFE